jgi:hypothetical protein
MTILKLAFRFLLFRLDAIEDVLPSLLSRSCQVATL